MVIVQLGGNPNRSVKTAALSREHPGAKVVLTGVENLDETLAMIDPWSVVVIDTLATDTLTNFIRTRKSVSGEETGLLVTDSDHVLRCLGLARIVWGSLRRVVPCVEGVVGGAGHESLSYCVLDWARAMLWKYTRWVVVRQPELRVFRIR